MNSEWGQYKGTKMVCTQLLPGALPGGSTNKTDVACEGCARFFVASDLSEGFCMDCWSYADWQQFTWENEKWN